MDSDISDESNEEIILNSGTSDCSDIEPSSDSEVDQKDISINSKDENASDGDGDSDDGSDDDGGDDDDQDDDGSDEADSDAGSATVETADGEEVSSKSSVLNEDVLKGKHALVQIKLWEDLLKMRINLQKAMVVINQLPQPDLWDAFMAEGGEPCQHAAVSARVQLKRLLDVLFQLQTRLLASNPETKGLLQSVDSAPAADKSKDKMRAGSKSKQSKAGDDEEITSESDAGASDKERDAEDGREDETAEIAISKKHKMSEYPELLAKRHKAYEKYRDNTIQKWDDKTRVMSGKIGKGFGAFDQSVVKQIHQTLSDKERLIARTHINRLGHRVLGKQPVAPTPAQQDDRTDDQQEPVLARDPLKDIDVEIFDDNDFYHHILREFIQHKNSYDPVVLTKQWLEIQQFRKKAKRNVDRKASKSRKTRYNVHKPLVNFMAPFHDPDLWTDEQRDDLFKNLFGRNQAASSQQMTI